MSNLSEGTELIFNEAEGHHGTVRPLFADATRFQCLTAFARQTGMAMIREELLDGLERGMKVRFIVGLDFYHTDPSVLEELLKLSRSRPLQLYVSRPESDGDGPRNFHPKVFTFEGPSGTNVLVGSANLTGGGFQDNHETSILARNAGQLAARVDTFVNKLIKDREVVLANADIVREYKRQHAIFAIHTKLAHRRAQRAIGADKEHPLAALDAILAEMKADRTNEGFKAQQRSRNACREGARTVLKQIAGKGSLSEANFLKLYERLVGELWHSGGLHRGKTQVARNSAKFRQTLRDLSGVDSLPTGEAFEVVHTGLQDVRRAGINVMTEVLHSFDNSRFAVMNQNSVHGLSLAGYVDFPSQPNRENVDATMYVRFCATAESIRKSLKLRNLTELDALFNYAYWSD